MQSIGAGGHVPGSSKMRGIWTQVRIEAFKSRLDHIRERITLEAFRFRLDHIREGSAEKHSGSDWIRLEIGSDVRHLDPGTHASTPRITAYTKCEQTHVRGANRKLKFQEL